MDAKIACLPPSQPMILRSVPHDRRPRQQLLFRDLRERAKQEHRVMSVEQRLLIQPVADFFEQMLRHGSLIRS